MLADHHLDRRLHLFEDVAPDRQLLRLSELRQIAAEEHEVGLRRERVDVVDRLERRAHEPLVELLVV